MPILKYFTWVSVGLLAALFVSSHYLPQPQARADNELSYKIAIRAQSRLPEAVSFSGENQVYQPALQIGSLDTGHSMNGDNIDRVASFRVDEIPSAKTVKIQPKQRKVAKRKSRKPTSNQYELAHGDFPVTRSGSDARSSPYAASFMPRMF